MTTSQVVPTDEELGRFARQQRVRKGSLDPDKVVRAVHATIDAQYPADGVEFELTLDFNASENQPIAMVEQDGYGPPEKWKFKGKKVSGIQTRRFKLVSIGYQPSFEAVVQELKKHGDTPNGQWREAFKAAYPKLDGRGPIGFADASWVNPHGDVLFPFVSSVGDSYFSRADCGFYGYWRWLVPASK